MQDGFPSPTGAHQQKDNIGGERPEGNQDSRIADVTDYGGRRYLSRALREHFADHGRHEPPYGPVTERDNGCEQRPDYCVAPLLATIVTFGYWAIGWFVPTMISEMLAQGSAKIAPATVISYVSNSRILITFGSLATYVVFLLMSTGWRRKAVLHLFFIGAFLSTMITLYVPHSLNALMMLLPLMAFFVPGVWVVFPIYLPELYPTRLRGTGAGFCFTFGRALSAAGPILTGALVRHTGSFVTAMAVPSFIYLLGPVALFFAHETRGQELR